MIDIVDARVEWEYIRDCVMIAIKLFSNNVFDSFKNVSELQCCVTKRNHLSSFVIDPGEAAVEYGGFDVFSSVGNPVSIKGSFLVDPGGLLHFYIVNKECRQTMFIEFNLMLSDERNVTSLVNLMKIVDFANDRNCLIEVNGDDDSEYFNLSQVARNGIDVEFVPVWNNGALLMSEPRGIATCLNPFGCVL
ncbi:OLC1v1001156C1 [Oldenlandia corymbosa var. corymbosa]|uniref:OLC1v1001156C1 n=1 Tax=Oldenlandia corymbosa var. corymbosa TaxID=529605 RepID=A0AAV1D5S1_OLDCO|nr:OLC1v1001156C1 [Oldenlandia corymbosa var. corymbosa]